MKTVVHGFLKVHLF